MKNLRLYETEALYTSDPIEREYPTVSYCKETDTVHFEKKPSYFIGTYNVTSTTAIQLLGSKFDLSQIKEMYIDDVKQETVVSNYTFSTTGEHTVKCVMKDNVTNMNQMFNNCTKLTSLDLSNFDTSNLTNMSYMFSNCISLTSLDLSNFNTNKVTEMSGMFNWCSSLTSLDLSNWDTSNVTDMSFMFYQCTRLTSLDLSNFDTSNVTNMESMFNSCTNLTSLNVSNFNTSSVTNMGDMFDHCSGLTSLDVSNWDTSNVTDMGDMFNSCSSLTSLDLSNWDTSNVTDMSYMFIWCTALTSITFGSQADVSNVTSYRSLFNGITTTGRLIYPSAYENAWNNILVTNQSSTKFPSTWTATASDYENQE